MLDDQNLTPAMKQYYEIKEKHKESIVFFRMGDFYEMFGEDAQIAHKVLGIALTSRNKNASTPILLAGIPFHAKEKYLPRLIEAGYKVALAEQISDPKLKGIVKREVVRIITPSTLHLEGENYDTKTGTLLVSIVKKDNIYALSSLDIASAHWICTETSKRAQLLSYLYAIAPQEIILESDLKNDSELQEILQKKYNLTISFRDEDKNAKTYLLNHFGTKTLHGYGIDMKELCQKASCILLQYSEENQNKKMDFLSSLAYFSLDEGLFLDEATIKNLDIFYNFSTKSSSEGTLFGLLNKTKTSQGKRYLFQALLSPLGDKKSIEKRLGFIDEFSKNPFLLEKIASHLRHISDLDIILGRLTLGRSTPRDLLNLKNSLQSILQIQTIIQSEGSPYLKTLFD